MPIWFYNDVTLWLTSYFYSNKETLSINLEGKHYVCEKYITSVYVYMVRVWKIFIMQILLISK